MIPQETQRHQFPGRGLPGEHPAGLERRPWHELLQPHEQHQQALAGSQGIRQVLPPRRERFGVTVVHDQGIRGQGQELVKHKEGQEVGRKRHAHRGRQGHGKTRAIAGLMRILAGPHIPDRIQRGEDPQPGREQRKEQAKRVGAQLQGEPWQQRHIRGVHALARDHGWEQRQDQQELHTSSEHCPGVAEGGPPPGAQDQTGREQRDQDRQQGTVRHVHSRFTSHAGPCHTAWEGILDHLRDDHLVTQPEQDDQERQHHDRE